MSNVKLVALAAALVALGVSLVGAGSASATLMCIEKPEGTMVLKCPEPGKFAYGVNFIPESHISGTLTGNATLELVGSGTVTCSESTFTLALKTNGTSNAGEGIMKTSFNSGKGGNCTTNVGGNTVASVTAENLSYDGTEAKYLGVNEPQGNLTIAKSGGTVQIKIVLLKTAATCIYKPNEALTGTWANASGAKQSQLTFTGKVFTKVSGSCSMEMRFSSVYNLKAEAANKEIYITQE